ncbi:FAD binding domain-containing protein [Polymorphobacter fuscus]|uniref:Carbon monoxide dehydrogenase n=1 Tax=Sandarakinorhabdus fusca TaxID=1439888 RepID=A0A7C9GVT7_9SPHN|nr:FAD binding domain-containing protein [Polymorphobacter fuscus]KAB7646325.1 carbon monoxide dehydrogenase [Polymorphobacter fuscus]MQT17549.1 carbon monoxide dehydrogenase [Polymorphobacter fuscus]NJC09909.1 carbon-monoxide dehydrogenase medium subunit [Polymorphobacter fuscus]
MRDFAYARPVSLADAASAFAGGGEAAFIAGGHTLLPAIKSRLRMPDTLVDLAAIPGLDGIVPDGDRLWIGALTTHAAVAAGAGAIPGLVAMANVIGDQQVRNRGTLGGVIANNDPAADYPAAVLALDGMIETDRASYAADDFFQGMFATALADGEIVTRVGFRMPLASGYAKFRNPASRYALVGVFVARFADGVGVAVIGAGPGVFRWTAAEAALTADFSAGAVAGLVLDADDLNSDLHASAEFRAHLAGVMLAQAVGDA